VSLICTKVNNAWLVMVKTPSAIDRGKATGRS